MKSKSRIKKTVSKAKVLNRKNLKSRISNSAQFYHFFILPYSSTKGCLSLSVEGANVNSIEANLWFDFKSRTIKLLSFRENFIRASLFLGLLKFQISLSRKVMMKTK